METTSVTAPHFCYKQSSGRYKQTQLQKAYTMFQKIHKQSCTAYRKHMCTQTLAVFERSLLHTFGKCLKVLQTWWPTLRQAWLNDIHSGWCILEITAPGRSYKMLSIWTWRSSSADTILTQCSYQLQRGGVVGCLPLLSRTEWVHPQSHRTSQRTGLEHQTSQLSLLEDQTMWPFIFINRINGGDRPVYQ